MTATGIVGAKKPGISQQALMSAIGMR